MAASPEFIYNLFPYYRLPYIEVSDPEDRGMRMFARLQDMGFTATWHNPFFANEGSIYGARSVGGQAPWEEFGEYAAQLAAQLGESAEDIAEWLSGLPLGLSAQRLGEYLDADPATAHPAARFDRRLFTPDVGHPERAIHQWTHAAQAHGLRPMADLVMNHFSLKHPWVLAEDALLTYADRHGARFDSEWVEGEQVLQRIVFAPGTPEERVVIPLFKRQPSGYPLVHQENAETAWSDIVSFHWHHPVAQAALTEKFFRLTEYFIDLGFLGFRCDAAYLMPPEVWRAVIGHARDYAGDAYGQDLIFLAETVGGPMHQVQRLQGVGFDFALQSTRWWDLQMHTSQWYLQEEPKLLEPIGRTIGFSDSHDTGRLIQELMALGIQAEDALQGALRRQILFNGLMGTGGMYLISGTQNILRHKADVWNPVLCDERGEPLYSLREDGYVGPREGNAHDLTPFIKEVIRIRNAFPVLNAPASRMASAITQTMTAQDSNGRWMRMEAKLTAVRISDEAGESLLIVLNPDPAHMCNLSMAQVGMLVGKPQEEVETVLNDERGILIYKTRGLLVAEEQGLHEGRWQAGRAAAPQAHRLTA